jgi:phage terminase large subunit-like protein
MAKNNETVAPAVTEEQVTAALAFYAKAQESRKKSREKRQSDPLAKEKAVMASKKTRARLHVLAAKAKAAGFEVTDAEIDEYLAAE